MLVDSDSDPFADEHGPSSPTETSTLLPDYATEADVPPPSLPPSYVLTARPRQPRIYTFKSLSNTSMLLLPSRDADPTLTPMYHISVALNLNPFVPLSYITTVRRGRDELGELCYAHVYCPEEGWLFAAEVHVGVRERRTTMGLSNNTPRWLAYVYLLGRRLAPDRVFRTPAAGPTPASPGRDVDHLSGRARALRSHPDIRAGCRAQDYVVILGSPASTYQSNISFPLRALRVSSVLTSPSPDLPVLICVTDRRMPCGGSSFVPFGQILSRAGGRRKCWRLYTAILRFLQTARLRRRNEADATGVLGYDITPPGRCRVRHLRSVTGVGADGDDRCWW